MLENFGKVENALHTSQNRAKAYKIYGSEINKYKKQDYASLLNGVLARFIEDFLQEFIVLEVASKIPGVRQSNP